MGRMANDLLAWAEANQVFLGVLAFASFLFFLLSILLVPVVVARLPVDFFVGTPIPFRELSAGRRILRLIKNAIGCVLIFVGVALLFLPGQGLLTILLGVGLVNFPGKHRLQGNLIRRRSIQRLLQWFRKRAGRDPLLLPETCGARQP